MRTEEQYLNINYYFYNKYIKFDFC